MSPSLQMLELAIGWQVYAQHNSPLDLGLIGLAELLPMFALALPAGHLADRRARHLVLATALVLGAAVAVIVVCYSGAGRLRYGATSRRRGPPMLGDGCQMRVPGRRRLPESG